jgi:DNA-binding transcriptional LysR family regulator
MDFRQLRYFVTTVELGSVSRAAAAIPISQPALTRSLRQLEEDLGVSLLERHPRGVVPTPAGDRYYSHAKSILAECSRAEEDVLDVGGQLAGEVAVGVGSLFAGSIMDAVIAEFTRDHPLVTVTLKQGFLEDLLRMLARGEIELAFCNFPVQADSGALRRETLLEVHSYVYAGKHSPLVRRRRPSWRDLRDERWVNVDQPHSQETQASLFINENLAPPRTTVKTNSLTMMKSLIAKQGFVGLLPEHLMAEEEASGAVKRLALSHTPIRRRAGLIVKEETYHRPVTESLAQTIRDHCRGLGYASVSLAG